MQIGDDGVEGLPLKLLIVSLIVSITLPIFYSSFEQYGHKVAIEKMEQLVNRIKSRAISVFLDGPGSVRELGLGDELVKDQRANISVGGNLNQASSRGISLWWGGELAFRSYIEELPVRMSSLRGEPIEISTGDGLMLFSCVHDENGTWVCVEKVIR